MVRCGGHNLLASNQSIISKLFVSIHTILSRRKACDIRTEPSMCIDEHSPAVKVSRRGKTGYMYLSQGEIYG